MLCQEISLVLYEYRVLAVRLWVWSVGANNSQECFTFSFVSYPGPSTESSVIFPSCTDAVSCFPQSKYPYSAVLDITRKFLCFVVGKATFLTLWKQPFRPFVPLLICGNLWPVSINFRKYRDISLVSLYPVHNIFVLFLPDA